MISLKITIIFTIFLILVMQINIITANIAGLKEPLEI